jgi:hypothetical protein
MELYFCKFLCVLGCKCHASQDIYCGALFKIALKICVPLSISTSTHTMKLNKRNCPPGIHFSLVLSEDEQNMSDVLCEFIHSCVFTVDCIYFGHHKLCAELFVMNTLTHNFCLSRTWQKTF